MLAAAALFDLDETLFDRSMSLRAFVEDQFRARPLGALGDLGAVGDRFLALDRRGRAPKRDVYAALLAETDAPDAASAAAALFQDYEARSWRFARAFDGAQALLRRLKASGRPVGIVTNGQTHIQSRSLCALKFDELADVCLISEAEGCRKPDAEIFLRAAARLGVDPADCVFVGDTPVADMAGARAVGMATIWFPNGAVWPDAYDWRPDAEIASLDEVFGLIESGSARAGQSGTAGPFSSNVLPSGSST